MYIIQTEGRPMSQVMRAKATVRIDTDNLAEVKELNNWTYEERKGHGNVHYIYLIEKKTKKVNREKKVTNKPYTGNRYVCRHSGELGVDNFNYDDKGNITSYVWYVYDKLTGETLDNCCGNRDEARRECKFANEDEKKNSKR